MSTAECETDSSLFTSENVYLSKASEIETELLKHFAYEQCTLSLLTLWQQKQIAQTNVNFPLTQC